MPPPTPPTQRTPWFRGHPGIATGISIALFAVVAAARFAVDDPGEPITLLFCLPIALLAVSFGFRAGALAGLGGLVLLCLWALLRGVEFSLLGWTTRAVPMLLLGALLGDAIDRLRRSEGERLALAAASRRHRDAVEINDAIVQHLTAAKWAIEAGHDDRALGILTATMESAQQMVSDLLREADMGPGGLRGEPLAGPPASAGGARVVHRARVRRLVPLRRDPSDDGQERTPVK